MTEPLSGCASAQWLRLKTKADTGGTSNIAMALKERTAIPCGEFKLTARTTQPTGIKTQQGWKRLGDPDMYLRPGEPSSMNQPAREAKAVLDEFCPIIDTLPKGGEVD